MDNRQRRTSLFFVLLIGALISVVGVRAQQKKPSQPQPESDKTEKSQPVQDQKSQPTQDQDDEPVAVTEKAAPAKTTPVKVINDDQYGNFRFPTINNKGEIAFIGIYKSSKNKQGYGQAVFIRLSDGTWKVVSEGEKASNLSESVYRYGLPAFNDSGDLTFVASYGAGEIKPAVRLDPNDPAAHAGGAVKNLGLFLRNANGLKSLVKLGDEVPNMPSTFSMINNPSTNNKGTSAFIGTYSDPDGRGLFFVEEGKLRLIVRSGQRLSATEEGTFSEHYFPTQINERNEVAFFARLSDKSGIFLARPSGLETIAIIGKPSPVKGGNYIGFGNRPPAINDKGEVAFVGFYEGAEPGRGLFLKGAGAAQIIAKSGDPVPGSTNNFTDFYSPAINARGDIAFIASFGGRNRGIFIKTAKGIETIAVTEQPVPGGGKDEGFNNFTRPAINDRGEVVFYAQSRSPTTGVDLGIYLRDEKGVLKTVVKRGEKIPK